MLSIKPEEMEEMAAKMKELDEKQRAEAEVKNREFDEQQAAQKNDKSTVITTTGRLLSESEQTKE